jgi:predicted AAA+ superfamily ATPase
MVYIVSMYDKKTNKKINEVEFVALRWAREYAKSAEKATKQFYCKIEGKGYEK